MCRLMAYSGSPILAADLLFRPSRSIVRQSFDARERANGTATREVYAHGQLNADGFGLAFYAGLDGAVQDDERVILPCVFTETQPAWNSKNLRRLSEKVKAPLFLAHVRAAGPALGVCDCKTHPFTYGRFSFMHNGEIAGFMQIRRKLLALLKKEESFNVALAHGATDTAVAFALFVDQLSSPVETMTSFAMVEMLKNTIRIIVETCEANQVQGTSKLNFVVSDGRTIVATRYTFDLAKRVPGASLYYASGTNFAPTKHGEEDAEQQHQTDPAVPLPAADPTTAAVPPSEYRIFHSERRSRMTIVASEPLTEVRSDWVSVPDNHVLVVLSSGEVLCAPFYLRCEPCFRAKHAVAELARVFSYMDALPAVSLVLPSPSKKNLQHHQQHSSATPTYRRYGSSIELLAPPTPPSTGKAHNLALAASKPPFVRCRSSRHHGSIGDDAAEEPEQKRTPRAGSFERLLSSGNSGGGGGGLVTGTAMGENSSINGDGFLEMRHPSHILAASGQVHVSAMVAHGDRLFCADGGAAGGRVCVYDLTTLRLVAWSAHWGILALTLDEKRGKLYGSRSDGQTIVWDLKHSMEATGRIIAQSRICIPRVGHVLSMCVSALDSDAVYLGSQDGFVRKLTLPSDLGPVPAIRPKQFRAVDCATCIPLDGLDVDTIKQCGVECTPPPQEHLPIPSSSSGHCMPTLDIARSHCGFVTSVILLDDGAHSLITAGSCGLIKRWDVCTNECVETLGGHTAGVMDVALLGGNNDESPSSERLFLSASLDGTMRAWRLVLGKETSFLRAFRAVQNDPLACLAIVHAAQPGRMIRACAGSVSGAVWIWDLSPLGLLTANELPSMMLNVSSSPVNSIASLPVLRASRVSLAVGAGSGRVSLWSLPEARVDEALEKQALKKKEGNLGEGSLGSLVALDDDASLVEELARLVALKSVSADWSLREDCFECAKHLSQLMERVGCETRLCFSKKGGLPCILGRIVASPRAVHSSSSSGAAAQQQRRAIFVYGHYDVVPAGDETNLWSSSPWELSGREGFVYGRGVSDDKGPCLAMLMAAAELKRSDRLTVDVVFCMEGEGETSLELSKRLLDSVLRDHREFATCADLGSTLEGVVISNNTWVDSVHPCVTYGMRGVVDLELVVSSMGNQEDLHSGVHGGGVLEPVNDLVALLHSVAELKQLLVDNTPSLTPEELSRLETVAQVLTAKDAVVNGGGSSTVEGIKARWASPSISVSTIRTSNPDDSFRRVPHSASARVSVYVAPGLTSARAKALVTAHFENKFRKEVSPIKGSGNDLTVCVIDESDPWIGDVSSRVIGTMCRAVETVWNQPALLVREGGSYSGMTAYLERMLGTRAVHLPIAQANDNAHLHDERISLLNLANGRRVFEAFLLEMGSWQE